MAGWNAEEEGEEGGEEEKSGGFAWGSVDFLIQW